MDIVIKGSIYQEDFVLINVYTSNENESKFINKP